MSHVDALPFTEPADFQRAALSYLLGRPALRLRISLGANAGKRRALVETIAAAMALDSAGRVLIEAPTEEARDELLDEARLLAGRYRTILRQSLTRKTDPGRISPTGDDNRRRR